MTRARAEGRPLVRGPLDAPACAMKAAPDPAHQCGQGWRDPRGGKGRRRCRAPPGRYMKTPAAVAAAVSAGDTRRVLSTTERSRIDRPSARSDRGE